MSEIVDIHPHIVSEDTARYPVTPIGGKRSDWSHERSITLEKLIESMDQAGVHKAAVVHSSTTYGFSCDYLADSIARYPDRLTGVFSINVLEPTAPAAMKKWFERGCTGMRIFSRGSTMTGSWLEIDDPRIFPCYEYAAENGISIASNVAYKDYAQMENVLRLFPTVNFITDHMGNSDFSDGPPFKNAEPLLRLAKYPNFYLKVVSRNFQKSNDGLATSESVFKKIVSEFGSNRMAWGSNYPASAGSLTDLLTLARQTLSSLPQSDQDWILGKTAQHLYPALAKKKAAAA